MSHPDFLFENLNLWECQDWQIKNLLTDVDAVVHLAAIVGFPACRHIGKQTTMQYNFEMTKRLFDLANKKQVKLFLFSSTYSNYGKCESDELVTEESPLYPQSLYAESKIAAEQYLLSQDKCTKPVVFRFATLFGASPRTRFDLIINQFTYEALTQKEILVYQGNYNRSYIHVADIVRAIIMTLQAPEKIIANQIFNVGNKHRNPSWIK